MSNTFDLLWTDGPAFAGVPGYQSVASGVGEALTLRFTGLTGSCDQAGRTLEFWLAPDPDADPVLHLADGRFSGRSGDAFALALTGTELVLSAHNYYWEVRDTAAAQVLAYGRLDLAPSPAFSPVIAASPVLVGFALADPNADRIPFWDDSAGAFAWLTVGSGLSITGTTLTATGGGGGGAVASVNGQTGVVSLTYTDVGAAAASHTHAISQVTGLQAALDLKAPLASPALTGVPTAPTPAPATASTQLATTAFAGAAVWSTFLYWGTAGVATVPAVDGLTYADPALQPDGKVLVAGMTNGEVDGFVSRFNPDGTLDATWGTGGSVTTDFGGGAGLDWGYSVTALPDRKVLFHGYTFIGGDAKAIFLRYTAAGALDTTFGTAGKTLVSIGANGDTLGDVAVDPDTGRIYACSYRDYGGGTTKSVVFRLSYDGVHDTGYGTSGFLVIATNKDAARNLVRRADGKIFVVGDDGNFTAGAHSMVTRLNADGTLDTGYGTGGTATLSFASTSSSYVALQGDKLVIDSGGNRLYRLNADATLDTTFGTAGIVDPVGSLYNIRSLHVAPDGKVVVSGSSNPAPTRQAVVVRLTADGAADPTFGSAGQVVTAFGSSIDFFGAQSVVQPDGRVLVYFRDSAGVVTVYRYNVGGTLDADAKPASVSSLAKTGSTPLTGAVTLTEGANVTITQTGQAITIAASGGGGGGTPGGSSGQVQYNAAGAFAGNAGFTYNAGTYLEVVSTGNRALKLTTDASTWSGTPAIELLGSATAGVYQRALKAGTFYVDIEASTRSHLHLNGGTASGDPALSIDGGDVYLNGILEFAQQSGLGTPNADCARIGAINVGSTAEVVVKDEAGNQTQISPHATDAPATFYDQIQMAPYVVRHTNDVLGIAEYLQFSRLFKLVEDLFKAIKAGRTFAQIQATVQTKSLAELDLIYQETFAAHNARLGYTGDRARTVTTWADIQTVRQARYDAVRAKEQAMLAGWQAYSDAYPGRLAAWQAADPKTRGPAPDAPGDAPTVRPTKDVRKPVPAWLAARGVS